MQLGVRRELLQHRTEVARANAAVKAFDVAVEQAVHAASLEPAYGALRSATRKSNTPR